MWLRAWLKLERSFHARYTVSYLEGYLAWSGSLRPLQLDKVVEPVLSRVLTGNTNSCRRTPQMNLGAIETFSINHDSRGGQTGPPIWWFQLAYRERRCAWRLRREENREE